MSHEPAAQPSLMERIAAFERPDLVVLIGTGDELPVYRHARALWQFYASHFPHIELLFMSTTSKLEPGEVRRHGHDLQIGIGEQMHSAASYASTGIWSGSENAKCVHRQMMAQDYLLRTRSNHFFLYHTTLTSVVDFRGLSVVLDHLPQTGCYGGPMIRLSGPPELSGLTFTSGCSTVFSRDVLERMRERYDPRSPTCQMPNDIWQALLLPDIARIALPSFSFVLPRPPMGDTAAVSFVTQAMLQMGQFHFRVKTVEPQDSGRRREDVDPWIMLRIMESILSSEVAPEANLNMVQRYALAATGGSAWPSRVDQAVFQGPRDFPLGDSECII